MNVARRAGADSRGLRHVALKSRDLARTEAFYREALGLEVAFLHPGMLFLETAGGGDLLNFVETRRRAGLSIPRLHAGTVPELYRD